MECKAVVGWYGSGTGSVMAARAETVVPAGLLSSGSWWWLLWWFFRLVLRDVRLGGTDVPPCRFIHLLLKVVDVVVEIGMSSLEVEVVITQFIVIGVEACVIGTQIVEVGTESRVTGG